MGRPGIVRSLTPTLPVADLGRSLSFYRDRLGFEVDTLWPADAPTLAILDAGEHVHLMLDSDYPGNPAPRFSGSLRFGVANCAEMLEAVGEEFKPEWGPEDYFYGCREFAVRDPDGYLVVFSERLDSA